MSRPDYDLLVLGAGSAGLVAAGLAADLGARVAIVERERVGGDCTWSGCVPSKALLAAAHVAETVRTAAAFGVIAGPMQVNMEAVRAHVDSAVDAVYATESPDVLAARGIEVLTGHATFLDQQRVAVDRRTLTARHGIIATGARPAVPPIHGLADVPFHTYRSIFTLARVPSHLIVIGAGPVGLELGFAFRRLGAAVTIVAPEILPREEPEVGVYVEELLVRAGVRLVRAVAISVRRDGTAVILATDRGETNGDALLVATGRVPACDDLHLERVGVAHDARGIRVDHRLQTTARWIHAAGDVTGGPQFTHLAGWQGFHAARNALLPGHARADANWIPRVTFLDPEIAQVGLTMAEAYAAGHRNARQLRRDLALVDRAVAEGRTTGFVKYIVEPDGRLLGATIIAPHAGELINEVALAGTRGLRLRDIAATIHAYPTWSTVLQQLAAQDSVNTFASSAAGRLAAWVLRRGSAHRQHPRQSSDGE